jgi:hypothetical protein
MAATEDWGELVACAVLAVVIGVLVAADVIWGLLAPRRV